MNATEKRETRRQEQELEEKIAKKIWMNFDDFSSFLPLMALTADAYVVAINFSLSTVQAKVCSM